MSQTENKNQAADIIGVLDCSGSMDTMGPEPPQAWNSFIRDQKKVGGNESRVSFYTFSDKVTTVYANMLLNNVEEYKNYNADGSTALYDAVRLAVNNQLQTERIKNVVLVIITDGKDNASRGPDNKSFNSSKEEVADLVKKMESDNNWQVIYLAADQDAFTTGSSYGAKATKCANFSKMRGGLSQAMHQISQDTAIYRTISQQENRPVEMVLSRQTSAPVSTNDYISVQPYRLTRS